MGDGGALGPHRPGLLTTPLADWVEHALGHRPRDEALFARALTHASRTDSHGERNYERLEFLGDRVLGLAMAEWLCELFPDEPEGQLTKRFNALVTGVVCAEVARGLGAEAQVRVGKQGHDDGIQQSDNVLGDVMEALLGALYREAGLDAARDVVRRLWADRIHADLRPPQHPKSALQEWAAANARGTPDYEVIDRSGPGHAPRFTVRAALGPDAAEAEGTSKQEAETAAAAALLARLAAQTPARKRRRRG